MRHQVNKFKIKAGKDANDMLLRKLAFNFVTHGKMITTETKVKALKSYVDKLAEKTKEKTEANKNYLLSALGSLDMVNAMFEKIGPVVNGTNGGYTTTKRLQQRASDGTMMIELRWVKPVVMQEVVVPAKTVSQPEVVEKAETPIKPEKKVTKTK